MSQTMPQSHYDCPCMEKCPLHHAMQLIGGKWKVQILCAVANAGAHPLQRPSEQAGRHLQHGAGLGPAGAGARWAGDTTGVSGGAGAGGIRPHGQLPGTAAHFGAAQRLGRGQDVSFRLDKYRNLSARYIIFHKLQWEL